VVSEVGRVEGKGKNKSLQKKKNTSLSWASVTWPANDQCVRTVPLNYKTGKERERGQETGSVRAFSSTFFVQAEKTEYCFLTLCSSLLVARFAANGEEEGEVEGTDQGRTTHLVRRPFSLPPRNPPNPARPKAHAKSEKEDRKQKRERETGLGPHALRSDYCSYVSSFTVPSPLGPPPPGHVVRTIFISAFLNVSPLCAGFRFRCFPIEPVTGPSERNLTTPPPLCFL